MKPLAVGLMVAAILGSTCIASWTAFRCMDQVKMEGIRDSRNRAYEKFAADKARNTLKAAMYESFGNGNFTVANKFVEFQYDPVLGGFTTMGTVTVKFQDGVRECFCTARFTLSGEVTSFTY